MIRVHRTECDGSASLKKDAVHKAHVRALYSIGYLTAWTLGGWCGRDDKISQDNRHSLEKPPTSFQQVYLNTINLTRMAEGAIIPSNTPIQTYEDHEESILSVAVFPDGRRMVTSSIDKTLRLWNLKNGVVLKKMEGHGNWARAVAITGVGQMITSGDDSGNLITWDGDTGESLTQAIQAHNKAIYSLDFSPDGTVLATGSLDETTKLWRAEMRMQLQLERVIYCGDTVLCVRYSSPGEHLAIATKRDIQIWNPSSIQRIATFEGHAQFHSAIISNYSLAWMPDGTGLLSGGNNYDPTIREWDISTWRPVGDPWKGHTDGIGAIAVNSAGTLVASASTDHCVRLWRLLDQQTIAVFQHSNWVNCLAFSADGKEILSGGWDMKISKWAVPEDVLPHANVCFRSTHPTQLDHASCRSLLKTQ